VVLHYYRIIVLFAGDRIFKIFAHLAMLLGKWLFASHVFARALSYLKVQIWPDNLHMMNKALLLIVVVLKTE